MDMLSDYFAGFNLVTLYYVFAWSPTQVFVLDRNKLLEIDPRETSACLTQINKEIPNTCTFVLRFSTANNLFVVLAVGAVLRM